MALAQVAALATRFPNDEYLSKLGFLQPSFYQFDLFDTRETTMTKAQEVNKDVLYADLSALITKYTQPKSMCKRNGCNAVVAPLLSPLVLDASGIDASLMLQIAAMVAVVSEWPVVPERKVDSVGGVTRTRIVNRFASWQEFWGGIVDDESFVAAAPRIATLLRIVLVQCHGGIENERTFSGMKFIHSDARNRLSNKHMNAVLRTWSEKDKLLADDRLFPKMWEHFQQHGLPR